MGLQFAKNSRLPCDLWEAVANKRNVEEGMLSAMDVQVVGATEVNADEEFVAVASRWTLSDFPMILLPPEFCDKLSIESVAETMEEPLAGTETVPRPLKGRAWFRQGMDSVFPDGCLLQSGPGEAAATSLSCSC